VMIGTRAKAGVNSQSTSPVPTCPSNGALVFDNLPSLAGLIWRSSEIRARIPPPHEIRHIVIFAARCSTAKLLQHTTRTVTPLQREVRIDFQVASSFLHSLLILVTTILTTIGAVRLLESMFPATGI